MQKPHSQETFQTFAAHLEAQLSDIASTQTYPDLWNIRRAKYAYA
jgi:hypothetical protein